MKQITVEQIAAFDCFLRQNDRASGTVENYLRHVAAFGRWLGGRNASPPLARQWKAALLERGYAPATVNAMLVPLNRFFAFQGWHGCKVKALRIQRRTFRENRRELTRPEYQRLLGC